MYHIPDRGGISITAHTKSGSNIHRSKIFLRVVLIFILYKSNILYKSILNLLGQQRLAQNSET